MVDENIIVAKLAELRDRTDRAQHHCPPTPEALATDRDALDLVSFNLMLAVQTSADIATHIIADEGWIVAKTLAQSFERLAEQGVITRPLGERLKRAVGLRNLVAHGYARVDPTLIHRAATQGAAGLHEFMGQVARWLVARRSP